MLLRESIRKTKALVHKTLRNFKSLVFGGYQKLPRSLSFNPFLGRRGGNSRRAYTSDQLYNEFYDMIQSDLNRMKRNEPVAMEDHRHQDDDASITASTVSPEKGTVPEEEKRVIKEKREKGDIFTQLGKNEDLKRREGSRKSYDHVLAKRMKELEMMDSKGDVEQVLDIEEALHYYSRLRSPVYLDIVDNFLVDMNSDLSVVVPQRPPQSVKNIKRSKSKRRSHGSLSGCR